MKHLLLLIIFFATPCFASLESEINKARQSYGLPILIVDKQLQKVAEYKDSDMFKENFFSHTNKKGIECLDLMKRFKVKFYEAGEILAEAVDNKKDYSKEAVEAWLKSPKHREVMLYEDYTRVGCYTKYNYSTCYFTYEER